MDIEKRKVEAASSRRADLADDASREVLIATITKTAGGAGNPQTRRWGVATPGPFDYERGISTIRGVAKLDGLYRVDLRAELAGALRVRPEDVVFLNDADAFLLGEWWAGMARGHTSAMGITLGTGLGSAFLRDGRLQHDGPDVPADARLDLLPFRGGPVEDVISRRGLLAAYRRAGREASDVREIADHARDGERAARVVFQTFGSSLGEFLNSVIERFAPSCVVFGGGIARSWPLFADAFTAACAAAGRVKSIGVAEHLEDAPLLGAALHATRR